MKNDQNIYFTSDLEKWWENVVTLRQKKSD